MSLRGILGGLACIALASCWYGERLYKPSDSSPAMIAGLYRANASERDEVYRVSILPDGMTEFDDGERKDRFGFVPLDPRHSAYLAWIPMKDGGSSPDEKRGEPQVYMLMVPVKVGEYRFYMPECKAEAAELARRNHAVVETGAAPGCRFNSRADVEKALRHLPRDPRSASTMVRIR